MVRTGKRRTRRKLEPLIPEAPDKLNLPKYLNIIRSGGYGGAKSGEKRREEMLPPMSRPDETPKALRIRRPLLPKDPYPNPAPEPERVPLLARLKYHFVSLFKVEPERPVSMPKVPELNFPALYTRFPVMKTVTKTTDGAGEIAVTYGQSYKTIPGVVISVKDPDNVFGTVFSTTLTGFGVRLFKMDHDHGGIVDDDGLHTPTINADGQHKHTVGGSISYTNHGMYGGLLSENNWTEFTNINHKHAGGTTGAGSQHRHGGGGNTGWESGHSHPKGGTGSPSSSTSVCAGVTWGQWCEACDYWLVSSQGFSNVATSGHSHPNIGLYTGAGTAHGHAMGLTGYESAHTHPWGPTGWMDQAESHRHKVVQDASLWDHWLYDVVINDVTMWTTADESPYHGHSGNQISKHGHGVAADGRVLLKNTNVTITYIAQEESS